METAVASVTAGAAVRRRAYIDWLRGVAVLIMIEWHSIDAWHIAGGRDSFTFWVITFIAGWAAPLFLFLAGLSVPFAGAARMARGLDRHAASRALQRRGWEIFLIAHLFRLQSFLLNPNASWNGLLKPDILNVLGLGLVVTAFCWERATTRRNRYVWLLAPAISIAAVVTPLAPTWWWPTLLPHRFEAYIRPVGNYGVFSLFPAVAYVLGGAFLGILTADHDADDGGLQGRTALWGMMLAAGGLGIPAVSLPPALGFWLLPFGAVSFRVGAMLLMLAASWRLLRRRPAGRWSPLLLFGQTSLFVYWVHVELAYGNISYPLHHALTTGWAIAAYGLLTVLMLGLAALWRRRPRGQPMVPRHMVAAGS